MFLDLLTFFKCTLKFIMTRSWPLPTSAPENVLVFGPLIPVLCFFTPGCNQSGDVGHWGHATSIYMMTCACECVGQHHVVITDKFQLMSGKSFRVEERLKTGVGVFSSRGALGVTLLKQGLGFPPRHLCVFSSHW